MPRAPIGGFQIGTHGAVHAAPFWFSAAIRVRDYLLIRFGYK